MRHLDEGTVHAFVDGALDAARVREVEEHLAACAACRDAVGEARGLVAASSRILAALDAVPGGVVPPRDSTAPAVGDGGRGGRGGGGGSGVRGFTSRWGWAAAAVMVLAVGTVLVTRSGVGERGRVPGRLAAKSARPTASPAAENSADASLKPSPAAPERSLPGAPAAAAPSPPQAVAAEETVRQQEAARKGSTALAQVASPRQSDSLAAADSLARAKSAPAPRRLTVDSVHAAGGVVVRTRYVWTNGIVLTLVATPRGVHAPGGVASDAMPLRTAPAAGESAAPVNVIQWTGRDGTRYRMSGATSTAELQRARAALF